MKKVCGKSQERKKKGKLFKALHEGRGLVRSRMNCEGRNFFFYKKGCSV